ncbi:MAG: DNA repair protein RecN [Acidobacteria bacterium]|nr:DNA repair protein RecN [Acidobacteriota bacterium]
MLNLLKIKNVALIDELSLEFGEGLNLLTGETGSGKSIIIDSLGALTGERASSDLIKEGAETAEIEGLFLLDPSAGLNAIFEEGGLETEDPAQIELIIRRELAANGRNRVFINNRLVTQSFLKKIGSFLADIHGQGEQATLFSASNHLEILDEFADLDGEREACADSFRAWEKAKADLAGLKEDESHKLQLVDILKFQVEEISRVNPEAGEDDALEEEKKRQNNVEKLSSLSGESYGLLYENEGSITSDLEKVSRRIAELSEFDAKFEDYKEGIESAKAVLEDLAFALRDFAGSLEFSPERLEEIENRLAEISRIKRKYGGSIEMVLSHLSDAAERLENIETAEIKEAELKRELEKRRAEFISAARAIHLKRRSAAEKFEKTVEANLQSVALEKARFVVNFDGPEDLKSAEGERYFSAKGFDRVEFYFSANPGESPKPLAKVASGGEASRVMLVLKTSANMAANGRSAVFDEVDAGIGGRVAEAVGIKLKALSKTQQVLCVTHQPQVAAIADQHFTVEKTISGGKTRVSVRELTEAERTEEIARMLAGENVTDTARKHAQQLIAGTKQKGTGR